MIKFFMIFNLCAFITFITTINAQQFDNDSDPKEPAYGIEIQKTLKSELDMIFFSINTTAIDTNDKDRDVIITAGGLNPSSDPDIYISTKNKFPSQPEENDRHPCTSFGTDICVITNNEISTHKQFYVGIKCYMYPCQIVYSVRIQNENHMQLNESRTLYFDDHTADDEIIFDVSIPSDMYFESILFKATLMNVYTVNQPIIMNVGKNNPGTGNDRYEVKDSWGNSKVLKLSKGQIGDTKNFKVLIEGGKNSIVELSVLPLQTNEIINLDELYEEYLTDDTKTNYYILVVDQDKVNADQDLDFYINPYSGQPRMYIHCGFKRPEQLSDYKWQNMNEIRGSGSRIIYPEQRSACKVESSIMGIKGEVYYLAVNSNFSSTYSLYLRAIDNNFIDLNFDENNFGILYKEKLHNYNLVVFPENPEDFNISINLVNYNTNNYFWVLTRQCNGSVECEIPLSDIKQYLDQYQKSDILGYKVIGSKLNIQFTPQIDKCSYKYKMWQCKFSITLYMDKTQPESSMDYEITALHSKAYTTLKEGVPVHEGVDMDQYKQYQINVQKSRTERIKSITFSLTQISGSQRIFVDNEKQSEPGSGNYRSGHYQSYFAYNQVVVPEDEVWDGTYYIYVKGYSTGYFTLQYTMTKEKIGTGEETVTYVQLKQDSVLDYYLIKNSSFYFQATIKSLEDYFIKIHPYYGVYVMYIALNNTFPPSKDYYTWYNENNQSFGSGRRTITEIRKNSRFFPSLNTIVYGVVEIDHEQFRQDQNDLNPMYPHFSIVLHTTSSVHELIEGKNFNTQIDADDSHSLKFQPSTYEVDFTLSFDASVKDKKYLTIYYQVGMFQRFPSDLFNDGYITGDQKILKINSSQFQSCLSKTSQNASCFVYITVESKIKTSYSIIITQSEQNDQSIKLTEGESLSLALLKKDERRNFHYIIHPGYDLDIYLYSIFNNLRLYGSIIKVDNDTPNDQYPYPNSTLNNFTSDYQNLYLNESQINLYCEGQCILLLTIDLIYDAYYASPNETFTIKVIQNSLFHIDEGIPIYGYVKKDDMDYYAFNFNTPNKSIFISLHGVGTSNPDLYVAYQKYPSRSEYDHQSSNTGGDYIAIDNETRTGWYMIGVFGCKEGLYALQYTIGDFKFMNLYANEQAYTDLEKGQNAYYTYYHYSDKGFSVQTFISQGKAKIGVKIIDDEVKPLNFCTEGTWSAKDDKIKISSRDKKFCRDCQYLIAVCSEVGASLNLMVNIEGEPIILRTDTQIKNQLLKNGKNYYSIYVYDQQKIELLVTSVLGGVKVYLNNNDSVSDAKGNYSDMREVSSNEPGQFYIETKNLESQQYFYNQYQFSILVVGQLTKNIYSILASEYQQKTMSFGVPITVEFLPQRLIQFTFAFDDQIESHKNRQFSVYLTSQNGAADFGTLTKDEVLDIRVRYSDENKRQINDLDSFTYSDISLSSQYYIYSLKDMQSGIFTFKIKNKYHRLFKGVVVVENGGVSTMVEDQMYTQIVNKPTNTLYEYYVQNDTKLIIEFNQCVGKSVLKAYSNQKYHDLSNKSDSIIEQSKLGPRYSLINVKKRNLPLIYFDVHQYSVQKINEELVNQYTFKIKPYPLSYVFPKEYMILDPKASFRWINEGNLSIRVNKVFCEEICIKNLDQNKTTIQYVLYISRHQKDLKRAVYCKSQYDANNLIIQANDPMVFYDHQKSSEDMPFVDFQVMQKNLEGLKDVQYLYFQVNAVLKINDEWAQYYETTFFYNPQELLMTNQTITSNYIDRNGHEIKEGFSGFWVSVAIVIIFVLAGLLILIFQKYRKTKSQLNYEMADMRNLGRVSAELQSGTIEFSTKNQQSFKMMNE